MWFHITTFFSANETGPALALVATSTALSQVIGAPIGAALMLMDGLRGIRGWKWLFMLEGVITMVFGVIFYVSGYFFSFKNSAKNVSGSTVCITVHICMGRANPVCHFRQIALYLMQATRRFSLPFLVGGRSFFVVKL